MLDFCVFTGLENILMTGLDRSSSLNNLTAVMSTSAGIGLQFYVSIKLCEVLHTGRYSNIVSYHEMHHMTATKS